jgi:hypothetical protein
MKISTLIGFLALAALAHLFVWLQINAQFLNPKFKAGNIWILLAGVPISWFWLKATEYGVAAFDGKFWPQRFIAFAIGMILYTLLTHYFFHEKLEMKSTICLFLAFCIVSIQIFWK